jgi:hypothetical protein
MGTGGFWSGLDIGTTLACGATSGVIVSPFTSFNASRIFRNISVLISWAMGRTAFSLILLPISWVVIVWMLHGLSRAYIVTLAVGILLDLHYFNFGLMTVILLAALSAVYFIHITVISSTNAASTLSLGFIFALIVYVLLLLSSGLTNDEIRYLCQS